MRHWVAKLQFEGRKPFLFGGVSVRKEAPMSEVERAIFQRYAETVPHGMPLPNIIGLQPGMLILIPEGSDA